MVGRGNPFTQNYSTGNNSEANFSKERVNLEVETAEHLYHVSLEVFDHFRRHTRSYVKKLGGLQTILELSRRRTPKRNPTYTEDSILVGNLEELVNFSLQ